MMISRPLSRAADAGLKGTEHKHGLTRCGEGGRVFIIAGPREEWDDVDGG